MASDVMLLFLLLSLLWVCDASLPRHSYTVAFQVQNRDDLDSLSVNVSTPSHPMFQRFLTPDELHQRYAPNASRVAEVVAWLNTTGLNATVTSPWRVKAHGYWLNHTVPHHLASVVRGVHNHSDAHGFKPRSRRAPPKHTPMAAPPGANLVGLVVAQTLSQLYNAPDPNTYTMQNSYRTLSAMIIAEGGSYSSADLNLYSQIMGVRPSPPTVVNHNIAGQTDSSQVETVLDMDMIASMSPQGTTLVYMDTSQAYGQFDSWCDGIMALPSAQWPLVVSTSYGEADTPSYYPQSEGCLCIQMLSAAGVTVVAASGDNGACQFNYGCAAPTSTQPGFQGSYPAICPYATAVGATAFSAVQWSTTAFPDVPICSSGEPIPVFNSQYGFSTGRNWTTNDYWSCATVTPPVVETPPLSGFANGGGFSLSTAQPAWQASAVNAYLSRTDITFPSNSLYTPSNRAFPDLSFFGTGAWIMMGNTFNGPYGGTSQSAPLFAAMLLFLNDWNLAHNPNNVNHSGLGCINPLLYQMHAHDPTLFNDVTTGDNKGGVDHSASSNALGGFEAAPGWDPVSGLGTPNIRRWIEYLAAGSPSSSSSPPVLTSSTASPSPTSAPTSMTTSVQAVPPATTVPVGRGVESSSSSGSSASTQQALFLDLPTLYWICIACGVGAILTVLTSVAVVRWYRQRTGDLSDGFGLSMGGGYTPLEPYPLMYPVE